MGNLEILKQEFINQKSVIEEMNGTVNVANTHPTPFEITEAIKTIPHHDLSDSTATEADVAQGKTFYSGNAIIKTGTGVFDTDIVNALFMFTPQTETYSGEITYAIPSEITTLRKYCFYNNYNKIHITFNDDLEIIDEYSFYATKNFSFENLNNLAKLNKIAMYSFAYSSAEGIDMGNLPNSIVTLGTSSFYNSVKEGLDFRFPDSLDVLGQSVYKQDARTLANSLDLSNYKLNTLVAYTFCNIAFACDLVIPETVKTIGMYFNHGGCFKNITIPSSVTSLQSYCFGGATNAAVSNFYLNTVTFESETPPSFGNNVFALQNVENGFKIYVPDNVIDDYKAISYLANYVENIFPMSEKE